MNRAWKIGRPKAKPAAYSTIRSIPAGSPAAAVIVEAAMIPVASPARQRNFVAGVQITLAQQFGVEGRGAFYQTAGCLRDVIVNQFIGDQRELYLLDAQPNEEEPYERLLGDAMDGDGALFTREDTVEAAWTVVDPVLATHHRAHPYEPGSWAPKQADQLIAADGRWHNPVPAATASKEAAL